MEEWSTDVKDRQLWDQISFFLFPLSFKIQANLGQANLPELTLL